MAGRPKTRAAKAKAAGLPHPEVPRVTAGERPSVGQTDAKLIKAQRIAEVERMMATNQWRTGLSALELAAKWQVSHKTVEGYAAEASRRIKSEFDPEERRRLKALWLANVYEAQRECRDAGDMSALGRMLDLEARALGHYEPDKFELSGKVDVTVRSSLTRKLESLGERLTDGSAEPGGTPRS